MHKQKLTGKFKYKYRFICQCYKKELRPPLSFMWKRSITRLALGKATETKKSPLNFYCPQIQFEEKMKYIYIKKRRESHDPQSSLTLNLIP